MNVFDVTAGILRRRREKRRARAAGGESARE